MINKKILPYKEATYDTYNCQRNLNSIIISVNEDNIAWFYNAFLQVYSIKDISYDTMRYNYNIDIAHSNTLYDRCPLVECFNVPNEIIDIKYGSISDFCIDQINHGFYLTFTIDRAYLYNNNKIIPGQSFHDTTIYGYDLDAKKILTIDFYGYKAKSVWKSFDDLNNAYESGKSFTGFYNGVVEIRNTDRYNWSFSIENYKENLRAYLNGTPITMYHYKYEKDMNYGYGDSHMRYYGVDTYKTFFDFLNDSQKTLLIGNNVFHLFMKHKLLLLNSVKYLTNNHYLCDNIDIKTKLNENYKNSVIILGLLLKYRLLEDNNLLDKIKNLIHKIENTEREILSKLLHELSKYDDLIIIKKGHNDDWYFNKKDNINKLIIKKDEFVKRAFTGNSIRVYANRDSEFGKLKLNIDGIGEKLINLKSNNNIKEELIYENNNLTHGAHIINIYPVEDSLINISKIVVDNSITVIENDSVFEYLGCDVDTKGNWIDKYGKLGYDIFYKHPYLPDNVLLVYKFYGDWDYHEIFEADKNNQSAVILPDMSKRIIPLMDSEYAIMVDVAITGEKPLNISLYILNYTGTVKKQNIYVTDIIKNETIFSLVLDNYYEGIYLTFKLKGIFRFYLDNGAKNVDIKTTSPINGVFFDLVE